MKSEIQSAGGDVELKLLPGARHHFNGDQWAVAWENLLKFLETNHAGSPGSTISSDASDEVKNDDLMYWFSPNAPLLGFTSASTDEVQSSRLYYMLPTCLSCGERFLQKLKDFDELESSTFIFGARSNEELETLTALFCSNHKDLPLVLIGYYETLISARNVLKKMNLDERFRVAKLVAEEIAMRFGATEEELQVCRMNSEFKFAAVASAFLDDAVSQSDGSGEVATDYLRLVESTLSGGAGNGVQPGMMHLRYYSRPEYNLDEYLADKEAVLQANRNYLRKQNMVVLGAALDEGISKLSGPLSPIYSSFKVAGYAVLGEKEMATETAKGVAATIATSAIPGIGGEIAEVIVGGSFDVSSASSFGEEYAKKQNAERMVHQAAMALDEARRTAPSVVVVPAE
jgi:hypothetical protein